MSEMPLPPQQPRPRRPFPWGPLAIVALGIMFLFLAVSGSFNAYFFLVVRENVRRGAEEQMRAQKMAEEMRAEADMAQAMAAVVREEAKAAQRQEMVAKERIAELERQLELQRKQLDEANRPQK